MEIDLEQEKINIIKKFISSDEKIEGHGELMDFFVEESLKRGFILFKSMDLNDSSKEIFIKKIVSSAIDYVLANVDEFYREKLQKEQLEEQEKREKLSDEVKQEIAETVQEELTEQGQEEPQKEIAETVQEELTEQSQEEPQEEIAETVQEELTEQGQEEPQEEITETVQEELTEQSQEEPQEEIAETVQEELTEQSQEESQEEIAETVLDNKSKKQDEKEFKIKDQLNDNLPKVNKYKDKKVVFDFDYTPVVSGGTIKKKTLQQIYDTVVILNSQNPEKEYLQIYNLRYIQKLPINKIAEKLNISQKVVSKNLFELMEEVSKNIE